MTIPTVSIDLTGVPQGKGRPRFRVVRTKAGATFGNAYTPAKTRDYESRLQAVAVKAMKRRAPIEGPLIVVVRAFMPIPLNWPKRKRNDAFAGVIFPTGKPDCDNIMKVIDALNGIVWRDDSQIVDGRVIKTYSSDPGLRIEVTQVESALSAVTGELARVGV